MRPRPLHAAAMVALLALVASSTLVQASGGSATGGGATGGGSAAGGSTATGADLQLNGSASTSAPDPGGVLRYTFGLKNSGPEVASAVVFSDTLPAGFSFTGATLNGVATACAYDGATVTCSLSSLVSGGSVAIVVNTLAPTTIATFSNTGTVSAATPDPKLTNNSVTTSVSTKVSGKIICVPLSSYAATSGYVPGAMVMTATYSMDPCTSRGTVTVQFVNTATGQIEFSALDPGQDLVTGLNTVSYSLAAFGTAYRVNFIVSDKKNGGLYQEAAATNTTPAAVANCATITKNNLSAGYWLTYAAIWESYTATDCGYGRERVEIRITNTATGLVVYDSAYWWMDGLLDYEGGQVLYGTEYQFDVEVHGYFGELLDSQSQRITTPARP